MSGKNMPMMRSGTAAVHAEAGRPVNEMHTKAAHAEPGSASASAVHIRDPLTGFVGTKAARHLLLGLLSSSKRRAVTPVSSSLKLVSSRTKQLS